MLPFRVSFFRFANFRGNLARFARPNGKRDSRESLRSKKQLTLKGNKNTHDIDSSPSDNTSIPLKVARDAHSDIYRVSVRPTILPASSHGEPSPSQSYKQQLQNTTNIKQICHASQEFCLTICFNFVKPIHFKMRENDISSTNKY